MILKTLAIRALRAMLARNVRFLRTEKCVCGRKMLLIHACNRRDFELRIEEADPALPLYTREFIAYGRITNNRRFGSGLRCADPEVEWSGTTKTRKYTVDILNAKFAIKNTRDNVNYNSILFFYSWNFTIYIKIFKGTFAKRLFSKKTHYLCIFARIEDIIVVKKYERNERKTKIRFLFFNTKPRKLLGER